VIVSKHSYSINEWCIVTSCTRS